ncbi:hypothetical protein [Altibacter sp. HG106]|uniref:hypothetical protein n=1 Tax=Altibacter sp. HG106 TaxID=3023937 RepID=UPI00234FF66D|nr:hypothetical protein [Altibacter sp. HG106]MDC7994433.1 hypothetical protein [Altibacter sp. HG106]
MTHTNTKVRNKEENPDMRLHNNRVIIFKKWYKLSEKEAETATEFMDKYCSRGYSSEIVALAKENKLEVSEAQVRSVRHGRLNDLKIFNLIVQYVAEKDRVQVAAVNTLESLKS